jgi:hypothetical protein
MQWFCSLLILQQNQLGSHKLIQSQYIENLRYSNAE